MTHIPEDTTLRTAKASRIPSLRRRPLQLAGALFLASFGLAAPAQSPPPVNVTVFVNRAVALVATHTFRTPAVTVAGTDKPLSRRGRWSVRRYGTSGCAPSALGCVAVLNTFPDDVLCEWTVQILDDDPTHDTILAANETAHRYFLYRPGSSEAQAHIELAPKPGYPALANYTYSVGSVELQLIVGEDGTVRTTRVLSGPAIFQQPTVAALQQWRFRPLKLGSAFIPWTARVRATFKSSAREASVTFIDAAAK